MLKAVLITRGGVCLCIHLFYPILASLKLAWASETVSVLSSDELARDVQGAEDMMERHQEIRGEIDAKNEK